MQRHQIDSVTWFFGDRRLSRRTALQAGVAAVETWSARANLASAVSPNPASTPVRG